MSDNAYDRLNSMATLEMIAGNTYTLEFSTFENDGVTPLDLTGGTVSYRIAPLGDLENPVIDNAGTFDTDGSDGLWSVILSTSDTDLLSNVYIGQPRVVDFGGDVFVPAQGRVLILPRILAI